jgi:hypothetical protein
MQSFQAESSRMPPPSSQFQVPIAEMKNKERTSKPNLPGLPNEIYAIFPIEKDCPAAEKPPTAAWISRASKVTIEINPVCQMNRVE